MADEVKFGFKPGYIMVFNAYQPDGDGRGINNQPLPEEHNTGYYHATPLTELESEDFVIVNDYPLVTYDDDGVVVSTSTPVEYIDDPVYYEEDFVVYHDNTENSHIRVLGDVLGSGEYTTLADDVATLVQQGGTVTNVYDETGDGGGGGTVLTSLGVIGTHASGDC